MVNRSFGNRRSLTYLAERAKRDVCMARDGKLRLAFLAAAAALAACLWTGAVEAAGGRCSASA